MATFNSDIYNANQPANTSHGFARNSVHLHGIVTVPSTMTTNDVLNFGYLPINAVVVTAILKAPTQLDSNGAPTLTFSLGVTGTAALWKSAITTVGRVATVSSDSTMATAGGLYKNTSGAKLLVIGTCANVAATPVAGTVEVDLEYYVEDAAGSAP